MTRPDEAHTAACRACGGATSVAFVTTVLRHHQVRFFKCLACESLQTEEPHWLPEAYSTAIAATDTGAMVRALVSQAIVQIVVAIFRVRGKLLDYGGGPGVLCRLLRDQGLDAYITDKYAEPTFAEPYSVPLDQCMVDRFELLSAIEVFEHWDDPRREIARLFALRPRLVISTTQAYGGEGSDWWYLARETGQHVFFFSRKCLANLARQYGYDYLATPTAHIFCSEPIGPLKRVALRLLLSDVALGMTRVFLAARLRGTYADKDHCSVRARLAGDSSPVPPPGG